MLKTVSVYKTIGETPYQTIIRFKEKFPEYKEIKVSYAGRLDPMAEGLLLLLIGDENKKRKQYENLRKTYEFTVLLGLETDSYDVLGKVQKTQNTQQIRESESQNIRQSDITDKPSFLSILENDIRVSNLLTSLVGKQIQPYPPFSSKAVNGKPLYWWARNNRLHEIEIPNKEIEIYNISLLSLDKIKIQDLRFKIQENISKVHGDFRQDEILKTWKDYFSNIKHTEFPILNCRVNCSTGTYIRSITHEIGQKLGTAALAYAIKRTDIGNYSERNSLHIK